MSDITSGQSGHSVAIYHNNEALAQAAAEYFASLANQFVTQKGSFTVAFSGGSTPKVMFALLAASPFRENIPWQSIFIFQVDERCVPPDHADSNFRMMRETLLAKVPLPDSQVYRMPAELADHAAAAQQYSQLLRNFFAARKSEAAGPHPNLPRFDLIFLGMGADGHTASLFPHSAALHAGAEIAVASYVARLNAWRITLTADLINNARNIAFLAGGQDKAATLQKVLQGDYQPELYPSQLIRPGAGSLRWLVDEAAASLLAG